MNIVKVYKLLYNINQKGGKNINNFTKDLFLDYEIIDQIGKGQSSCVYLAFYKPLRVKRIIKVVNKFSILYSEAVNEVNLLKKISHNRIPVIYDIKENTNNLYIIMEYIKGDTLKEVLTNKILSEETIISYMIELINIIKYLLYNNILYMDLKPDNILVNDNIYLIDFGFKTNVGNYKYSSKEQIENGILVESSYIYTIGKIFEEVVIYGRYSKRLKNIIEKCTKNRDLRISNFNILEKMLKNEEIKYRYINIFGIKNGSGSSYLSIMLYTYLSRSKLVIYEDITKNILKELPKIEFFENVARYKNLNIKIDDDYENYDYIIRDYGCIKKHYKNIIYNKDDINIIVVSTSELVNNTFKKFLLEYVDNTEIIYAFNFSRFSEYKKIKNTLENRSIFVEFIDNPFVYNKKYDKMFSNFFEETKGYFIKFKKLLKISNNV